MPPACARAARSRLGAAPQAMKFRPVVPARRKAQEAAAGRGAAGAGPSGAANDARFEELLRTVRARPPAASRCPGLEHACMVQAN